MNKLVSYVKAHPYKVAAGALALLGTVAHLAAAFVGCKDEPTTDEPIEAEGWVE